MSRRRPPRAARLLAATASAVVALTACGGGDSPARPGEPSLATELIQYRRDEVDRMIKVAVVNRGARPFVVERLVLTAPGFTPAGPVAPAAAIPAGQTVDLRTSYGEPLCTGRPTAGARPEVSLRVRTEGGEVRDVTVSPADRDGWLERIHHRECLERRLRREVPMRFGSRWRAERVSGDVRLHGTLEVRLGDPAMVREVTQVAGTVIYDLAPEGSTTDALARLDADRPSASIPVVVSVARCDGHARAETKKPYAFPVWVRTPGGEEAATTLAVGPAARLRLRAVCPL